MNHTRPKKPTVIITTPEMDNWLHPQTPERKERIKSRMKAATERYAKLKMIRTQENTSGIIISHVGIAKATGKPLKGIRVSPALRRAQIMRYGQLKAANKPLRIGRVIPNSAIQEKGKIEIKRIKIQK
jgi:hypothetical protein